MMTFTDAQLRELYQRAYRRCVADLECWLEMPQPALELMVNSLAHNRSVPNHVGLALRSAEERECIEETCARHFAEYQLVLPKQA